MGMTTLHFPSLTEMVAVYDAIETTISRPLMDAPTQQLYHLLSHHIRDRRSEQAQTGPNPAIVYVRESSRKALSEALEECWFQLHELDEWTKAVDNFPWDFGPTYYSKADIVLYYARILLGLSDLPANPQAIMKYAYLVESNRIQEVLSFPAILVDNEYASEIFFETLAEVRGGKMIPINDLP